MHLRPEDRIDAGKFFERKDGRFNKYFRHRQNIRQIELGEVFSPAITSDAIFAIGTPVAFATNGTVRDARGLTSRT